MTAKRASSTPATRKRKPATAARPATKKAPPASRPAAKKQAAPKAVKKAAVKKAAVKKPAAKAPPRALAAPGLREVVLAALADMKAVDVRAIDVRTITDITDMMVVASGTSDRHVKSIADRVLQRCKEAGFRPLGMEGERDGEWVLVDLYDLVLHVMLPRVREFYALEKLWDVRGAAA